MNSVAELHVLPRRIHPEWECIYAYGLCWVDVNVNKGRSECATANKSEERKHGEDRYRAVFYIRDFIALWYILEYFVESAIFFSSGCNLKSKSAFDMLGFYTLLYGLNLLQLYT